MQPITTNLAQATNPTKHNRLDMLEMIHILLQPMYMDETKTIPERLQVRAILEYINDNLQ